MNIREVQSGDVELLASVAVRAFDVSTGERVGQALQDFVAGKYDANASVDAKYILLEEEGEIKGMCGVYTLRWVGPQVRYLGWFFVDPKEEGNGYGRALLQHAIESAAGARWLMVETDGEADRARKLYERMGFKELAQVPDYWPSGDTLVLMGLRLS